MAATFIKGTGQPRLIRAGSVSIDKYGLSTASAEWWAFRENDLRRVTALNRAHPDYGNLYCERLVTSPSNGGYSLVAHYAGIDGAPTPIYEIDMGSIEAPIETHPDFADFAGTGKDTATNGAIFRVDPDTGLEIFDRFGAAAPNGFRGVTSFLIPCAVVRATTITTSEPSAGSVGSRTAPPRTFGVTGDWLKTGVSAEKRGRVYVVREEWKASGINGWNSVIYPG